MNTEPPYSLIRQSSSISQQMAYWLEYNSVQLQLSFLASYSIRYQSSDNFTDMTDIGHILSRGGYSRRGARIFGWCKNRGLGLRGGALRTRQPVMTGGWAGRWAYGGTSNAGLFAFCRRSTTADRGVFWRWAAPAAGAGDRWASRGHLEHGDRRRFAPLPNPPRGRRAVTVTPFKAIIGPFMTPELQPALLGRRGNISGAGRRCLPEGRLSRGRGGSNRRAAASDDGRW